eukprot:5676090-Amphidinium_carterae.1
MKQIPNNGTAALCCWQLCVCVGGPPHPAPQGRLQLILAAAHAKRTEALRLNVVLVIVVTVVGMASARRKCPTRVLGCAAHDYGLIWRQSCCRMPIKTDCQ